jgi:selenocysteine lyase/cysteine desulfurase
VAEALAAHKVMAGGGDFYAVRPLEALGIAPAQGVLRLSFVHYTSEAEVAQLIEALDRVL